LQLTTVLLPILGWQIFIQVGLPLGFGSKTSSQGSSGVELFWRLKLAMSQNRLRTCGYFMAVEGATQLPPPRSDDSAAAWSATAYLLSTVATDAHLFRS